MINDWDFRKLAKRKFDAIVASIIDRKYNPDMKVIGDIVFHSRQNENVKEKIEDLLEL